jgi:arginyl-tRNA synthetase
MNIFNKLKEDIISAGKNIDPDIDTLSLANLEIPKDPLNGDLSTNIAMIIAAKNMVNPREIAIKFKELLSDIPYIANIEIAGSGFINFTIKAGSWQDCIKEILLSEDFGKINIGKGEKVNIEYVSANPTGPMHIGHARCAVYGDALARLLTKCGYQVTKEYYVNDAGNQIDDLTATSMLRYKEALTGEKAIIPYNLYPGEYLIDVGKKIAAQFGDSLIKMPQTDACNIIKDFVVNEMLDIIKKDLRDLDIEHEIFFSEESLHKSGKITEVINILTEMGLIYEGQLPEPKGKKSDDWSTRTQKLFKSSVFGDSQDRPVQKSDSAWSYLASDLAYAKDKIDRGFDNLIYVLGADHSGYVKRIEAIVKALGKNAVEVNVKICQLVNFVENGVPMKMSKRSGHFTTVNDVTNEVDKGIIRFMMLTRKNDVILDFDLEKVKEQSKDNPIFYVQYALVRTNSILSNCKESIPDAYNKFTLNEYDLSLLSSEEEIHIIKLLASWHKVLDGAAKHYEPHRIAFYLLNLASKFHSLWNFRKENNDYRFLIEDNIELTASRLALAQSIQKIIKSGFDIIGIEAMTKM